MAFAGGPIGIGKVCPAATGGGNEACPEEAAVDFGIGGRGFASPGARLYGTLLDVLLRPGVLNPSAAAAALSRARCSTRLACSRVACAFAACSCSHAVSMFVRMLVSAKRSAEILRILLGAGIAGHLCKGGTENRSLKVLT